MIGENPFVQDKFCYKKWKFLHFRFNNNLENK